MPPESGAGDVSRRKFEARLAAIGGGKPREYLLHAGKTAIGSGRENDVVIDDATVSRYHAVIRPRLGGHSITDLESTNGTFVNGVRVRNPVALQRGDDIRFGNAHFAYLVRRRAAPRGIRSIRPLAMAALVVILFATGFLTVRYRERLRELAGTGAGGVPSVEPVSTAAPATASSSGSSRVTAAPAAAGEPAWLALLNWYRRLCGLSLVTEDPRLSAGDQAHVQYLLTNYADALRSGTLPGEEMHEERDGSPGYTPEGATAGKQSDVDFVYWHGHKPDALVNFAILDWISGAFHRLPLLNPNLHQIGYDDFCGPGLCVAALNAMHDVDPPREGGEYARPVRFPPAGNEIDLRTFTNEWPDPLTSCSGYAAPTGLPITLTLGTFLPARLESFAIESTSPDGAVETVEACGFDAETYANPDSNPQSIAREVLKDNATVVVIPRRPLERGASYKVSMAVNGKPYAWQFTVSR